MPFSHDAYDGMSWAAFRGLVVKGQGSASTHIADKVPGSLSDLLGVDLYPGTLNLLLDAPARLVSDASVSVQGRRRYLSPVLLNGVRGWLHRWPYTGTFIAEVVSDCRLRSACGLEDGAIAEFRIPSALIVENSNLALLMWRLLWGLSEDRYARRSSRLRGPFAHRVQKYTGLLQWP